MGIFISVPKTIECVIVAVIYAAFFCVACYRTLGALQACGYSNKKLMKWAGKKSNQAVPRQVLFTLLSLFASGVISMCFSFLGEWAAVAGLSSYVIFFSVFIWADNRVALRVPVSHTPRFKRLYTVLCLISAIIIYLCVTLLNFADFIWNESVFSILRYCPLAFFPLLILPVVGLANALAKIYEIPHNRGFVRKAQKKLAASGITVVGITGSFGKTSTKRILTDILSKKFRVLSTPASHNTPLGLALTLNNADLSGYDIFIAEMGARHIGDIAELCEICPPDYSVITGICPQHIESFLTVENIVKAKGEILINTKKSAVIAEDCFSMFENYSCPKEKCACASDIVCSKEGTEFTLFFGNESARVKTKLLGRHSANNIAIAAQVAHTVGMTLEEISAAIPSIDFVEHRLQLTVSNGVNILDDGYNSNVKGAEAALEVLRSFDGGKIVVTPGLVELGVLEEKENYELGKKLAGLDFVILVGETLITPVKKGYLENGGDEKKLLIKPSLAGAQEALKDVIGKGDTVLFLNDLPDVY